MGQTQKRKKRRQAYLQKKAQAYIQMSLAALLIVLILWVPYAIYVSCRDAIATETEDVADVISSSLFFFLFMSSCCLVAIYCLARSIHQSHQRVKHLPYVPPITADTLPAQEVLVRGSEASPQEQSKVLLRGAQSDQEASAQQLLRSSRGQE